jgi:hypothetical protein
VTPWELREANQARWQRDQPEGHCHYNTHHQLYQAVLPGGKFVVAEPWLIEKTDAQFELWLARIRQIRRQAREGIEDQGREAA